MALACVRRLREASGHRDGSDLRELVTQADTPVWSRDGSWIAFRHLAPLVDGTDFGIARADGTQVRLVPKPGGLAFSPESIAWSPDGATVALFPGAGGSVLLIRTRDLRARRVPLPVRGSTGEWSPNGRNILFAGQGIWRLDVRSGRSTKLARFGFDPTYSRSGRSIAYAGGGRCGERAGIYRLPAAGGRPRRLTNDCVVEGSPGPDELVGGEFPDVIRGLEGDDTLTAFDDFYYEGDRLVGGRGDDRLFGGLGTDFLVGGPGRDHIEAGAAPDLVDAVDGERDEVSCGTQPGNDVERDVVYADRIDVVRSDCEYVYRRGTPLRQTSLSIKVWPRGEGGASRKWTLACVPLRGTLPNRARACAQLAGIVDPFAPVDVEAVCPLRRAEAAVAIVDGRFRGRRVHNRFTRLDGCEIARWNRVRLLFPVVS